MGVGCRHPSDAYALKPHPLMTSTPRSIFSRLLTFTHVYQVLYSNYVFTDRPAIVVRFDGMQVTIFVSLLASPVVHVIYGVVNGGPGDSQVRSILWSQAFIVLTAVSLAWSVRDMITLWKTTGAAAVTPSTTTLVDPSSSGTILDEESQQASVNFSPETCIIEAAEVLLSGHPGSLTDERRALEALSMAVGQAPLHGLTVDTPVLQTANALHAWRNVIQHQGEVERDIRETDRWGLLAEKYISMNAGMPFMVGIVQVGCLVSVVDHCRAFERGPRRTSMQHL